MTDEEILGSLRQDILHIPPLREQKLASYYEAQRQELVDQCIAKAIRIADGQEVPAYVTRRVRRVPRTWWAWAYRLWKKKKTAF